MSSYFSSVLGFFALFLVMLMPAKFQAIEAEELTYEALAKSDYTDHVQTFEKLFRQVKVRSFLEFGLGYGTKYFLDNCDSVVSFEILMPDQSTDWADQTTKLFRKYSNWVPIVKYGTKNMQRANELACKYKKDPAHFSKLYLLEIRELCNEVFANRSFEMAFVDPGFHMRADLVNELFGRVPIIAAHDTNCGALEYRWSKIVTPPSYERFVFNVGMGTTIWVLKERKDLIAALRNMQT